MRLTANVEEHRFQDREISGLCSLRTQKIPVISGRDMAQRNNSRGRQVIATK